MKVNVKRKSLISAALLLTSLGVTTSCIDNSYDLNKDIDMTINVGGQYLAFPVGSTEKVTLDKIIEVKEGDDLQAIDGAYHLIREDEIAESTTTIESVTVTPPVISIPAIDIKGLPHGSGVTIPGFSTPEIGTTGNINIEINKIDGAVHEVGSLTIKPGVNLTFNLKLTGNVQYSKATINELKVEFPKFLQFGVTEGLDSKTNILTIKNKLIKPSGYEISLPVKELMFGAKSGEGKEIKDGSFSLSDEINLTTSLTIDDITLGNNPSLSITPSITLGEMTISSITGTVQPKIEAVSTDVKLSNLPDFLQDDEVKLDITNPIISFKANNPLAADIELDGVMTGYKKDKVTKKEQVTKIVKIGSANEEEPIILAKGIAGQQTIYLTRTPMTIDGIKSIVVENLNDIIETIPDRIAVELTPSIKTKEYLTVDLGKDYAFKSGYKIDIPLSFGGNMKIVYKDSVDGFRADLEDIEFKKATIAMTVDNAIPLQLQILEQDITPKDVKGKKIDGVKVTVTGLIAESKDGVAASTSQLAIAIEETVEGAMNKMDGIVFKVTAVPGQATNVQLRSNQWVQFKEIKLRVPNGVKVDLN